VGSDLERWNDRMLDDPDMDRRQFHDHSRVLTDRKRRLEKRRGEIERQLECRQSRVQRLAEGGRMVIALIEEGWAQKLYLITKQGGQLARTELADVIFAPMVRGE
jgi:hypothetical protein